MKKFLTILGSLLLTITPASLLVSCQHIYQPTNNEVLGAEINQFLIEHFQVFPNSSLPYDAIKINSDDADSAYFQDLTSQNNTVTNYNPIINFAYDDPNHKFIVDNVDSFALNTNDIKVLNDKSSSQNQLFDIYKLYLATSKAQLPSINNLQSKLFLFLPNNQTFNYSLGEVLLPIVSTNNVPSEKLFYFESINLPSNDFWQAQLTFDMTNYFSNFLPTIKISLPEDLVKNPTADKASINFLQAIYNNEKKQTSDYLFFGNVQSVNVQAMMEFLKQYFTFDFSINPLDNTFTFSITNNISHKVFMIASHLYNIAN